ncbi:DUF4430 domain-containing protein [Candidatus Nomurabacteria bacterium]|nr:DUF4430 domain-containing protein [Candidatus Nomurabacteria bacterium]
MKKKIISFSLLIFIILLIALFWQLKSPAIAPTENIQQKQSQNLEINFQFDKGDIISLQYPYQNSESLLDITQKIAQEESWDFQSQTYAEMGTLITQIRDKVNGDAGKYWQYQVNQKTPLVSVDQFFPKNEDLIEWKFEASAL